ncbi:MAG: 2,3-bisphosphoglycerate-independent phosphoglycerate mutase [Candidatus Berkelbacteria bacterium]
MENNKKVVLIVLDGWGYSEKTAKNAIMEAKTPFFDQLWSTCPHALLEASGEAVGLPEGQMGNSEVGHTIIGAGKAVYTDFVKISKAAREGNFKHNAAFNEIFNHIRKYDSTLHLSGLIGHGGVHSHSDHLFALMRAAKDSGIEKIAIHVFTDGRDTAPQSANQYIKELEAVLEDVGVGFIATASGRFYAMDRDANWNRVKKAEDAIFAGIGNVQNNIKPSQLIEEMHQRGILDEHIEPIVFLDQDGKNYQICENDGVIFFNFRKDRARMMTQRFIEKKLTHNVCVVSMTEYDIDFDCLVAFPPEAIETSLAAEISKAGMSQVHIAETEKFAHATYYLNRGQQEPHKNESHILVDSRKDIETHDLAPEMRAEAIAGETIATMKKGTDFIFINIANPDMVGHTGNYQALITAIETTDHELERIVKAGKENNYDLIVTADHGNAELSVDPETGQNHTAHTTNPVPIIYVGKDNLNLQDGTLADVAPTVLSILGITKPETMTGKNILK